MLGIGRRTLGAIACLAMPASGLSEARAGETPAPQAAIPAFVDFLAQAGEFVEAKQFDKAEAAYKQAVEAAEQQFGRDTLPVTFILDRLARFYLDRERYGDAVVPA